MSDEQNDPVAYAWDWAANYAKSNGLFDQPMKANGYPVDGSHPTTPTEKYEILEKLAVQYQAGRVSFLEPLKLGDVATLCSHGSVLCALCNFIPESWKPTT